MASALFVAAAVAPLHAMQADAQSSAKSLPPRYDHVGVMKKLLFWDMDDGPAGVQFGQGTFAVKTGSGLARFNTVFSSPIATQEDVDQVEIYMDGTAHSWWVAPDQEKLKKILETKGYKFSHSEDEIFADFEETASAVHNNNVDHSDDRKDPEITIETIPNEGEFPKWIKVSAQGSDLPKSELWLFFKYVKNHADLYNHQFYIGYVDGVPVSTAVVMYAWGENPVVHLVSTLKEYRNKGYATALMKKICNAVYLDSAWPVFLLTPPQTYKWFKDLNTQPLLPFADVMTHDVYVKGGSEDHEQAASRGSCRLF